MQFSLKFVSLSDIKSFLFQNEIEKVLNVYD